MTPEERLKVFPTGVGMNQRAGFDALVIERVPHRRGDEPKGERLGVWLFLCSPQAWG